MKQDKLNDSLAEVLEQESFRPNVFGEYHPSEVTGCPLKTVLDWMTEDEFITNSYTFAGTAVHYYLQESGILTRALEKAGYHPVHTSYEVSKRHEIENGVEITGTCDVIADNGDETTIIDLKYSSLKPEYAHGRVMKYFSQVNTYSMMFEADKMALWLISSNERDNLPANGLSILSGEPAEDNWEIVKRKVLDVHRTLDRLGYDTGSRLNPSDLEDADKEFWEDFMQSLEASDCPAYNKECNYCSHSEYCPVKNGELNSGMASFKNGT